MSMSLRLREIASQAGRQNGCRLYDVYRHRDRIQVFIDKPPKGPVTLNDCQNVFHSLRFLIRSEFPQLLESRRLEVSSPGIEKRLRDKWHFEEALGETLKITTSSPVEAENQKTKKVFRSCLAEGRLISIKNGELTLKADFVRWQAPISLIKSARVKIKGAASEMASKMEGPAAEPGEVKKPKKPLQNKPGSKGGAVK